MTSMKYLSVLTAAVVLFGLAGCNKAQQGTTSSTETGRSSGSAMVRETNTKPGAGGMGEGGNLGTATQSVEERLKGCNELMTQHLGNAGQNYDQRLMDILISQHENQLRIAKEGAQNAKHAELKKVSTEISKNEQKELDQLKSLRKEWFKNPEPTASKY